jgi:hypothetical protein
VEDLPPIMFLIRPTIMTMIPPIPPRQRCRGSKAHSRGGCRSAAHHRIENLAADSAADNTGNRVAERAQSCIASSAPPMLPPPHPK